MKKQKKVLFVANNKGFSNFNAPYMHWFKTQGWIVDNASPGIESGEVDHHFDVDIHPSPLSPKNYAAYKHLKRIINDGNYDLIHVHTPMGAVLGRLASISARKKGTKVMYTAHGFHFFKGAPLKNWLLYYPVEKLLAPLTDSLVTINDEDYQFAQRKHLSHGEIHHIDGVGVNLERFHPISEEEKMELRRKYGLTRNDFVGLYIGRPIPDKNHKMLLYAIPEILKNVPNFKMLFAGDGEMMEQCVRLVDELGIANHAFFLGPRSDVPDLCRIADIHISTSVREGQGVGNIEAMASGCALVISDIRGHRDVCIDQRNGFLFKLDDPQRLIESVIRLAKDSNLLSDIASTNIKDASRFSVTREVERMADIYNHLIDNEDREARRKG